MKTFRERKIYPFSGDCMTWFRKFLSKIGSAFRNFMSGRNGTDKLNMFILGAGVVVCLVSVFFVALPVVQLVLTAISYALLFWATFRCFSRNTYKRYRENRRFLLFFDRLRDREHRYFICPKCRQDVRVPRGKGKISITCPRCKEKFIRKT